MNKPAMIFFLKIAGPMALSVINAEILTIGWVTESFSSAQIVNSIILLLQVQSSLVHVKKWPCGSKHCGGLQHEKRESMHDALVSKRVYKAAFSHEKAREIILDAKGKHFDPDVVDAFTAEEEAFQRICRELADSE